VQDLSLRHNPATNERESVTTRSVLSSKIPLDAVDPVIGLESGNFE
jgi:hypothetical protein